MDKNRDKRTCRDRNILTKFGYRRGCLVSCSQTLTCGRESGSWCYIVSKSVGNYVGANKCAFDKESWK